MNILIIFVAGISVGWAADKLYHSLVVNNKSEKKSTEETIVETHEENMTKAEKKSVKNQNKGVVAEKDHDDLSQLKGVGPKLAEALDNLGIYTYKQLSGSPVDTLLEQLRETGGRFSRSVISSIVERAKLAVG